VQKENFVLENTKQVSAQEIMESFLSRYYLDAGSLPNEILLPVQINLEEIQPAFEEIKMPKVSVVNRGPKLKLIQLGKENARQYLEATSDKKLLEEARLLSSLKELQRVLDLPNLPGRIEAFDISNIHGKNAVGSMVVFDFARPKKEDYRRFKIRLMDTPDDFAMMREMLARRLKNDWPKPELMLIDGGKGQLSTAQKILIENKISIPAIGLAKKFEEIFLPGKSEPVILPTNSIARFLLQRIRDEAHRFAITYHRKLRSRSAIASALDQIPGIGPGKKKILLTKFKSLSGIKKASLGELANIVGNPLAAKIKASL
jgi:excinuclease ABC subunit C